ncbi:hypothetical protein VOLCADRAFT_104358 [Volvox carteri f. nagariensis]|uniref:RING-type E3 ubiquitin transferase (cysteine targeting) n=1 Tax=Volvox carteri f. nagariensis TaxID=3068 RepID=D8TT78_VOLCA|nr:uncharacterized protein VOLCADRAFT_104358 [Volvox carteri f. nagariensis]EFJ49149.1 hypothetical protein VOLCADRAFT_104358 [Volvox carteri f. nagariensis]|eukprot:XP_002949597.1 hypothetical protein VOLCADRAFT_104358 [Volvox carteri f. nagariensis]
MLGQAASWEPELRAVLSLMVFCLSVWAGRATPGSELLNLRYRDERAVAAGKQQHLVGPSGVGGPGLSLPQRVVLGLGTAVLPYTWSRLCRTAHEGDWAESEAGSWRRIAWRGMRWCEAAVTAAAAVNSWVFLVGGNYRSLMERLVGARLVWRQAAMARIISFEYLNRQLVWQELSEALLLLLPLLDINRLRRTALRALPRPSNVAVAPAAAADGGVVSGGCPLCGSDEPLTAVLALPCRHTYCYYCLRSHTLADPRFVCPVDGDMVQKVRQRHRYKARMTANEIGHNVTAKILSIHKSYMAYVQDTRSEEWALPKPNSSHVAKPHQQGSRCQISATLFLLANRAAHLLKIGQVGV